MFWKDPFAEFDEYFNIYNELEKKKRSNEANSEEDTSNTDRLTKLGANIASVALRIGEEAYPIAKTAASIIGQDKIDDLTFSIIDGIGHMSKELGVEEKLLRIFNNKKEVDSYLKSEERLIASLIKAIKIISEKQPLVILFDSYERLFGIDDYIWEYLFLYFPENVILVFSGRNSVYDKRTDDWKDDIHFFEMEEFREEECYSYLRKHGIRRKNVSTSIWQFTKGVPSAVALAVEAVRKLTNQDEAVLLFQDSANRRYKKDREEIIGKVASRFLSLVSDKDKEIIYACAVLGQITQDAFEYLVGRKISRNAFNKLNEYSFIRRYGVNLLFHNTVRRYVLQNLRSESQKYFNELNSKAIEYYDCVNRSIRTL